MNKLPYSRILTIGFFTILSITVISIFLTNMDRKVVAAQLSNEKNQSASFQLFTDSQGRFSIEYPIGWQVKAAQSRYEPMAVGFFSNFSNKTSEVFGIMIGDITSSANSTVPRGFSFTEDNMRNIVDFTTSSFHKGFPSIHIDDINLSINKISGHPAITIQGSGIINPNVGIEYRMMYISSVINGELLQLIYTAPVSDYFKHLMLLQHIVDSFKLLT
jgi:hypothetical protein